MKKFALVLSGGGFKGAFQIGALRHLRNNWQVINPGSSQMKFDVVAGVSVGSLNGVLTACNEFDELEKLWLDIGANVENIYTSDFIDTKNQTDEVKMKLDFEKLKEKFIPGFKLKFGKILWQVITKGGNRTLRNLFADIQKEFSANYGQLRAIADNTPLKNRLATLVRKDKITDCIYRCGFVSLDDGEYYSYRHTAFKSDEDFRNGILASTAMPIVWEPVGKISVLPGHGTHDAVNQAVDGGIRNVTPLSDVIAEINADDPKHEYTIIIINCNSGTVERDQYHDANIAEIALRSLNSIAITEIFNNDISEFLRINNIIEQVRSVHPGFNIYNYKIGEGQTEQILRPFKAIIIQTDPGVLGDPLVANEKLNAARMKHGEEKAERALAIHGEGGGKRLVMV